MYEKYYGLTEKPFHVTPDPRFLYLSTHHREALACLRYGVQERTGFVAIIGEVGTGKTTLLHALLNDLDARTKTAFIFSTALTAKGLMRMMASDFGIRNRARTKTELLLDIHQFLLSQYAAGVKCVLVVDEAQNLNLKLLEEIRMLSNLETDREKLLQIILIGQPELAVKLAMPRLRQLRQRISIRYQIEPLSREECGQYIAHRLRVAGLSGGSVFDKDAVDELFRRSGGIPRLINLICDRAMLLGYARNQRNIGRSLLMETVENISEQGILDIDKMPAQRSGVPVQIYPSEVPWRKRVLRHIAAASGLLFCTVLFSMPVISRDQSKDHSSQMVPPWVVMRPVVTPSFEERKTDMDIEVSPAGESENRREPLQPGDGNGLSGGPYSLHVASFRGVARANRLVEDLQASDLQPVFVVPVQLPESGRWQRVFVGLFGDKESALQMAREYNASGIFQYAQPRSLSAPVKSAPTEWVAGEFPGAVLIASEGAKDE